MCDEKNGLGSVLVVDDDGMIRALISRLLKRWNFSVVTASDGVSGVERFRESENDIVCVILDWKLPRMDGNEVVENIRQINRAVPVILISGYPKAESTAGFQEGDLADFLLKPFKADVLRARLLAAIDGRARGGRSRQAQST